jgi:F420-non-reducing hydrogenase small subunit
MKISTIQLASCCGCHVALINIGTKFIDILSGGNLEFSPVLMDVKSIPKADVALVEGGVRNNENIEKLEEMREKTKTLIALGTCACYGGIPGIGSGFSMIETLAKAYGDDFVPENIPHLEKRVSPIDSIVEVDYYIPGCPPPTDILADAILKIIKGEKPTRIDLPVCAECDRIVKRELSSEIKSTLDTFPDKEECLLSQGYICLGSVSRSGCGAPCTKSGVPCMGCRGPIDRVLVEAKHGILYDLTKRISHFTGKSEEEIREQISDYIHTFYGFTLSMPELRRKDTERVSKLIHKIEF